MAELSEHFLPWTVWEVLQDQVSVRVTEQPPGLHGNLDSIRLSRDRLYQIKAVATGAPHEDWFRRGAPPVAGSLAEPVSVLARDGFGDRYELQCGSLARDRYRQRRVAGQDIREWCARLTPYRVSKTLQGDFEPAWLTDWYINGPRDDDLFTRGIEWSFTQEHRRGVEDVPEGDFVHPAPERAPCAIRHCAFVQYQGRSFLVYPVPNEVRPRWFKKIAIEYRPEWGGIPDEHERQDIADLISFVVGRRLLWVGSSTFDERGIRFQATALNPGSSNPRTLSARGDRPPAPIVPLINGVPAPHRDASGRPLPKFEELLGVLVPRYLDLRKSIALDEAVGRYVSLPELYLNLHLPLMRVVLEIVVNGWFKSNKSKSKGTYLSREKMNA